MYFIVDAVYNAMSLPTNRIVLMSFSFQNLFLVFISLCFFQACSSSEQDKLAAHIQNVGLLELNYETNLVKFNQEINHSLEIRKLANNFYRSEMSEGKTQYLDANDITQVQNVVALYAENRDVLLNDIAYYYRDILINTDLEFDPQKPTYWRLHPKKSSLRIDHESKQKKYILSINPNDEQGRTYIKVIKLTLSAALTLYDNYIITVLPYEQNGSFRRKINYDNFDYSKGIESLSASFHNATNYRETYRAVLFIQEIKSWEKLNPKAVLTVDKENSYFNLLIAGSYYYQQINRVNELSRLSKKTIRIERMLQDILVNMSQKTLDQVSEIFGNTVGLVAFRDGYLRDMSEHDKAQIENTLKPADIMLEKTPFRLTDRFIPGYWGHVAIWAGSKEQLQTLGVWDSLPELYSLAQQRYRYHGPSFQSQIEAGHRVIEALRPGVQINTLEHFLNIDDMAVVRDKKLSSSAQKRYLLRAFSQIGKDYDFNFDVETDKKIVCSELAFVVYDDYQWSVEKAAGRYTISPDHVSEKASGSGPFTPVLLYKNGKKIEANLQEEFNQLISL